VDASLFDALARAFIQEPSRRGLLSGLGAAALSVSALRRPWSAEAKKKRKKKLKKNEFGCVNVGGKCKGNSANCCSGICEGKKPKKGKKDKSRCVGHNESNCQVEDDACTGLPVGCTTTAGVGGLCVLTTGNAPYCLADEVCSPCTKDTDCVGVCGAGAACVVCDSCPDAATFCVGLEADSCS
jgi:hypothetical protein